MLKELRSLDIEKCSNLNSISLKQSYLQVISYDSVLFRADLPNREVAEWFSYKSIGSTVSFDIPPILGDNFFCIAIWVVFKLKNTCQRSSHMKLLVTNKTKGTEGKYPFRVRTHILREVQSKIKGIRGDHISVESGDRIMVSFPSFLNYGFICDDIVGGEVKVKVKMCGTHVILKTPSPPC